MVVVKRNLLLISLPQFFSLCVPNTVERHQQLLDEFTQRFDTSGQNFGNDIISVELVEQCIM